VAESLSSAWPVEDEVLCSDTAGESGGDEHTALPACTSLNMAVGTKASWMKSVLHALLAVA